MAKSVNNTKMKLVSQLQLVIIILFACLPLEVDANCIMGFNQTYAEYFYQVDLRHSFLVEGRCFSLGRLSLSYVDARTVCEKHGFVLARIHSASQFPKIVMKYKQRFGVHDPLALWVGASDLEQEGRFLWLADNSELERDSSLWAEGEPNNKDDTEDCVEINVNARLSDAPCKEKKVFLCAPLQGGLVSMKVNNIEMHRNQVLHPEKGNTLDISCFALEKSSSIRRMERLTLTLNDELLMVSQNTSLTFHIPVTKCNYSGIYSCNADFIDKIIEHYSSPSTTASTSISVNIQSCANGSDSDHTSHNVDKGRPFCSGKDTELSGGSCFRYFGARATFKDAEESCKHNDAVLAAFKSLSHMQNIFKEQGVRNDVWVGANNLQDIASFRWVANRRRLRTDSPMWSKKLTSIQGTDKCLMRNTDLFLYQSECHVLRPYLCMNLYTEVLKVTVNDEPKERNAEIFISKNSTMTIECLAPTTNDSIILSIRFQDHVIMTVSNQSRLVYDVDNAQCEDAGRYSCNVDFTDSGISVEYFIIILIDCPVTVTLSTDQMVATPSHHIMTSVGSDLSFNCTVNYAKEDFCLQILKNDKVLTTQYDISTVTFNLSVTACKDSDVYDCQYHQYHPRASMKSSPLFMGVHNCPIHILSFGVGHNVAVYEYYEDDKSVDDDFDDDESEVDEEISGPHGFESLRPKKSDVLYCYAETYSRPTTLLIKSESGNVLKNQKNSSVINLHTSHMTCEDKGKVVCQITDHLRNETDSKSTYTWVRNCEPSLCHHKKHTKRLHPHLSHNVTATFCFMMDRTLHRIHEKQLFHDGRLLETNSTSKYVINITADMTNPYKYTLDVTLVNVQVEDLGKYVILLKFNDRTVLIFFITVQNSVHVQSSSHHHFSPFMSYGLPCVIFLLLVLVLVAIYSIVKKTSCVLKNASNSGDVAQVMSDDFKYTTLRED